MRKRGIIFIVAAALIFSGCYTIRKKFTRKKRHKKNPPVYIDFKDYPSRPSRDAYIDYYLFVKGWIDELTEALSRGNNFKREKRAINEAIMNLEQIISFYNAEGKEKLYPLYEEFLAVKGEVEKNPAMSETKRGFLIKRLEHLKREFERNFNYVDAEKWME